MFRPFTIRGPLLHCSCSKAFRCSLCKSNSVNPGEGSFQVFASKEMGCSRGIEILVNKVPDCRVAVLARIDRSPLEAHQGFLKPA